MSHSAMDPFRRPPFVRVSALLFFPSPPRFALQRRDYRDEFLGVDYFGIFPALWKVPLVAGYQEICGDSLGAFKESIVGLVRANRQS